MMWEIRGKPPAVHQTKGQVPAHLNLDTIYHESLRESSERLLIPQSPAYLTSLTTTVMISYLADFHVRAPWDLPS